MTLKITDCILAGVVVLVALYKCGGLTIDLVLTTATSFATRARLMIAALFLVAWTIIAGSALSMAFLHTGITEAAPKVSSSHEVETVVNWLSWHLARVVPLFDLTATLNWDNDVHYSGSWMRVLLLAGKLVVVALIAIPIALLVKTSIETAQRRQPKQPLLTIPRRFLELCHEASEHLDAAERHVEGSAYESEIALAERATSHLEPEYLQLEPLFGPGEVLDAAEEAVSSIGGRLNYHRMIDVLPYPNRRDTPLRSSGSWTPVAWQELENHRKVATGCIGRYWEMVSTTLADAARQEAPRHGVPG